MRYRADKGSAVTSEVGRAAGSRTVLLDGDSFESSPLECVSNSMTVALWIKPLAMGSKTGNAGSANGMIASSGSGYNDGWRLVVNDWKTRQPSFELGREKGAFAVRAADGLSAGFWNHLAATWDGAVVRIYVNGMLSEQKPYNEPAVAPRSALRVGFSGYGVGSLRMAVDELAVYDRALPPEEVAALAMPDEPLPAVLKHAVRRAQELRASDAAAARQGYLEVAGAAAAPAAWKLWAELAAARLPRPQGGIDATAAAAVFESPSVAPYLRGQAVELLLRACRQGAGSGLPSRVLAQVPEYLALDAETQRLFALALAASYAREGDADGARRVYEHVLSAVEDSPRDLAEIRLACAETLRGANRWDEARAQYAALLADMRQPVHVRGLAALGAAQTWQYAGQWAAAEEAYRGAAGLTNLTPHLKAEAEACAAACANIQAGRAARDAEAGRERPQPLPVSKLTCFVSPAGDDANPGTREKPFATLARARDWVRAAKANGALPVGGATVWLRGGRYAVTNTLVLTEEDSGSFNAPVMYRAWPGEEPVLDGGFRLKRFGFQKVRDPAVLARLPEESRSRVRVANLKEQGCEALARQASYGYGIGNKTVRELFADGKPLPIARWPNEGNLKIGEVNDATNGVFVCESDRLSRWGQAGELMASGYWGHLWAGSTLPVAAVDARARTIALKERSHYGLKKDHPFYVLNLLEEIDRPGEWYVDTAAGLLYVWPERHPWFSEWVLSRWDKPFIEARGVREVVFQGIIFEYGQQHALVLDGCVNATVAGCEIRRMGGTALTALRCANLKIYGNLLHTLGHTGMHVSGGNRKNLASGRIVIENNEVRDFGRRSRTYNPALLLEGCGGRVAHNWFHHAPSSAMRIEGNDHLIEYNQVDHVVAESDDQGGIDMWGNPSYRGVVIRYNRWQDIGGGDVPCGQAGIRFDDAISGMVVYGNWFERCSNGNFGGVQIHGGQFNIVDNNVFVGCRYGVSFTPWGAKRWTEFLNREDIRRKALEEVNVGAPPYSTRYPELAELVSKPDINRIWRNVFVGCDETLRRAPGVVETWNNTVAAALPDLDRHAAMTLFQPLPLAAIGPYEDPMRRRN